MCAFASTTTPIISPSFMIRYSSRRFSPVPVGTGNWSTRVTVTGVLSRNVTVLASSSTQKPKLSSLADDLSLVGALCLAPLLSVGLPPPESWNPVRELQRLPRGCGLFVAPNLERTSAADCIAHRCTILGEHRKARSRPLESKICPKEPARGFAESIFAQVLPAAQYSPVGSTSFVTGVHCRDHADYPALAVAE